MVTNNAVNEPTAASGKVLQGQGVGTTSAFSTATYPATATSTGVILRADGTNWSATTATYPATTTANQLLYSSATSVVGGLATANSGVLATSASGVPSIDTTNFAVLSTGLQLKGNNTNTASPAGFIGEVKIASNTSGTALSNNTIAQLSSITLTAGNWEITGTVLFSNSGLNVGNVFWRGILSATTASSTPIDNQGGNIGMGFCENTAAIASNATPATHPIICLFMGPCNVSISTNTTYYLNGGGQNSGSFNVTGLGVIRAIRIG